MGQKQNIWDDHAYTIIKARYDRRQDMANKKGQVEVTINWVYVLVAGGIILLFFIGVIVKQKTASEEGLAIDVVRVMENIFVGAGVSEKTKNFIDTSGISEFTLYFDCLEGVGEYGLQGKSANVQNVIDPLFSSSTIHSPKLITWSVPYLLPFKVIDFLYVTAPNIKYYLYGQDDFIAELEKEGEEFGNIIVLDGQNSYMGIDPQGNDQIRVVDISGTLVKDGFAVPEKLLSLADEKVTALVLQGESALFFQKDAGRWHLLNTLPIPIVSLGGARDAAKLGAVFSTSPDTYQCNMGKAFLRLKNVAKVQLARAERLAEYYDLLNPAGFCTNLISHADKNAKDTLGEMIDLLESCTLVPEECDYQELIPLSQEVERINEELKVNCIALY